jgi:hypothetical protein
MATTYSPFPSLPSSFPGDDGLWYYWEASIIPYFKIDADLATALGYVHPWSESTSV